MKVEFLKPEIKSEDVKRAVAAMKSGWLTYGPISKEFEASLAAYLGAKDAAIVGSGTAALHSTLASLGIGAGDEVITSALSAAQTANAIEYTGAKPVFVDVDPATSLIDLNKIEAAITAKTKAIVPVHYYGSMIDIKRLVEIAKKHHLLIVEDAAHALESNFEGVRPGQLTAAAFFSFHAAKNITSGQGGAMVSNDPQLVKKVRVFCDSGMEKKDGNRRMMYLGYRYPLTSFQAALLIPQLNRIEKQWKKRKKWYQGYEKAFKSVSGLEFPKRDKRARHAYDVFAIYVDPKIRDEMRKRLSSEGVETGVNHDPIPLEPYYVGKYGYKVGEFPNAEKRGFGMIALPLYPSLRSEEHAHVVASVQKVLLELSR